MKLLLNILLLFTATMLLNSKCSKDPVKTGDTLPPITQEGKNTFGCKINDTIFTPGGGGLFYNVLSVQYDSTFQGGQLYIKAERVIDATHSKIIHFGGLPIHNSGYHIII